MNKEIEKMEIQCLISGSSLKGGKYEIPSTLTIEKSDMGERYIVLKGYDEDIHVHIDELENAIKELKAINE